MKTVKLLALALVATTLTMCKSLPASVPSTPEKALAELIAK